MAEQRFTPPRNFTDYKKLAISGELWDENIKGKRPNMKFRVVNGNLRITVYTNHPDDPENQKPVNANMDPVIGNIFLNMLERAATDSTFTVEGIENKNHDWSGGQRSERLEVMSKVLVGRDGEGIISIRIECKNSRPVVFRMLPTFLYSLIDANGRPLDPAIVSARVTMGWVSALKEVLGPIMIDTLEKKEAQDAKEGKGPGGASGSGGGNFGGGQRRGGGGGGGNWNKGGGSGNSGGNWGGGGGAKSGGQTTDVFADVG